MKCDQQTHQPSILKVSKIINLYLQYTYIFTFYNYFFHLKMGFIKEMHCT